MLPHVLKEPSNLLVYNGLSMSDCANLSVVLYSCHYFLLFWLFCFYFIALFWLGYHIDFSKNKSAKYIKDNIMLC